MGKGIIRLVLAAVLALSVTVGAGEKKVLFIDSYHEGYAWSDGITSGIKKVLGDKAELKIFRMDTKRNGTDEFKKSAAEKAIALIEEWKPDVVIAADDNAAAYIIKPYHAGKELPFVFCGLNWDAKVYEFSPKTVCGMEEVALIPPLLAQMKTFAKGDRIGFLTVDNETGHKEAKNIASKFGLTLVEKFALSFADWKAAYKELQGQVDMIILENFAGLTEWNEEEAKAFVLSETTIPTGCIYDFMAPFTVLGFTKSAEEQGEWAASAALRILAGESPEAIGVTQNKKGQLFVNLPLATKIGAKIPLPLLKQATVIK